MISSDTRSRLVSAAAFVLAFTAAVWVVVNAHPRAVASASDPQAREWIQLFNGKDLTGWTPKFAKYALGENPFDTVSVEHKPA